MDPLSEYFVLTVALGSRGVFNALEWSRVRRERLLSDGWRLVWARVAPDGRELHLVYERPDDDPPGDGSGPRWSCSTWLPGPREPAVSDGMPGASASATG